MFFRYPLHLYPTDSLDNTARQLTAVLGAEWHEPAGAGFEVARRVLVGPRDTLQLELVNRQLTVVRRESEESAPGESGAVAWGVYCPPDTHPGDTPLLMIYRNVGALGNHPVLVRENHLVPGELVVVPETSETFAVLSVEDGSEPVHPLQWLVWRSNNPAYRHAKFPRCEETSDTNRNGTRPTEPATSQGVPGERIILREPLLSGVPETPSPLTADRPHLQVTPVLSPETFALLERYLNEGPWIRREGEIYTQDSLDVLAWIRSGSAPELKEVFQNLTSQEFVDRVAWFCGQRVESLKEVYAYRLREQERILVHADGTSEGEQMVRMNFLIATPENRPVDFRFWNPQEASLPPVEFSARPNHAVFFLMGPETPHDVVPVQPGVKQPRINIIMTFGTGERVRL